MHFENHLIYFLLKFQVVTYLGIEVIMFNNPVNCSKLTLLSCRITEDIHLNSTTTKSISFSKLNGE